MKRIKIIILSTFIAISGLAAQAVILPQTAGAAPVDVFNSACSKVQSELCPKADDKKLFGANSIWTTIINTFIFIIGAVAVIMIIVGGIKYVLSAGDQAAVTSAKNTIQYAIVGLIVAILASAIVNFVINVL